jgi:hypothetical protein
MKAMSPKLHGVTAEFANADELMAAATKARDAGYKNLDAYSPFPIHGLEDAIGFTDPKLPWMIFIMGCVGACVGMGGQIYLSAVEYAHNVGGRPFASIPSFIPVTFECTVLFAALTAVFGMIGLNGLPKPYHPMWNVDRFERASQDAFFLTIEAGDKNFDAKAAADFLATLHPMAVTEVAE